MVRSGIAAVAAATLLACASSVRHDFRPGVDFSRYTTYDWMPDIVRGDDPRVNNSLVDGRFRSAIEAEMEAKGLRKDEGNPDVRVGYIITLDDRVDYETTTAYWGPRWRRGLASVGTTVHEREYTVGTLIIDIFDANDRELLWRGSGEGRVDDRPRSPQEQQESIRDAVRQIMANYPPGG